MEEKIKIHLPKYIYDIFIKDAEAFEFYKNDGVSINKNAFLSAIINNYYKTYIDNETKMHEAIILSLQDSTIKDKDYLATSIIQKLNKLNTEQGLNKKNSEILSLKPTKDNQDSLMLIERYIMNGIGISEFFRNMLKSYSSLPMDQREKIIFKTEYDTIIKAIEKKRKIFILTKKELSKEASPYEIATSNEELHCYLLAKENNQCTTFRLSRIKSVQILNSKVEFSDEDILLFQKMIAYGPQFTYFGKEYEIRVKLTDKGKKLYRLIYIHRPVVEKIENDIYYFNCSYNQIIQYFERFGKEALIIKPNYIKNQLFYFYRDAYFLYKDQNKTKKVLD